MANEDPDKTGVQPELPVKPPTKSDDGDAFDHPGSIKRPAATGSTPILLILLICGLVAIVPCLGCAGAGAWFFAAVPVRDVAHAPADVEMPGPGAAMPNKNAVAAAQINIVDKAVNTYFIKHNRWPDQLRMLVERDEFGVQYLENREQLLDPWGQEFQYDVGGNRNNGDRPDIWTVSRPDQKTIGNWPRGL